MPSFLWCEIIPQANTTLHMLQSSHINPWLSAYEELFEVFNFNKKFLAPIGTKVIIHEKKKKQCKITWYNHGQHRWYVSPAPEHYRNYRIYISATKSCHNSDSVIFFPSNYTLPQVTPSEQTTAAVNDLIHALK